MFSTNDSALLLLNTMKCFRFEDSLLIVSMESENVSLARWSLFSNVLALVSSKTDRRLSLFLQTLHM